MNSLDPLLRTAQGGDETLYSRTELWRINYFEPFIKDALESSKSLDDFKPASDEHYDALKEVIEKLNRAAGVSTNDKTAAFNNVIESFTKLIEVTSPEDASMATMVLNKGYDFKDSRLAYLIRTLRDSGLIEATQGFINDLQAKYTGIKFSGDDERGQ